MTSILAMAPDTVPAIRNRIIELDLNYNLIFYKGLGISIDLNFGMIPAGIRLSSKSKIPYDTLWANGFYGDPFNGVRSNTAAYYWGGNFKLNYTFNAAKHLLIQPEVGIKTVQYFIYERELNSVFVANSLLTFLDGIVDNYSNPPNSQPYRVKRNFYPDFIAGINFLVYPKNPKHCIKIGLNFDYGFVPRLSGYYTVINVGKYNSSGKVEYGSTHFGISVGYQFMGQRKKYSSKELKENFYLVNPQF
jgi:hypothetical protein